MGQVKNLEFVQAFFIHKWSFGLRRRFTRKRLKRGMICLKKRLKRGMICLKKRLLQESLVPEDFSLCDDVGQKTFLEGMSCARKFSWGDVLGQKTFLERMFGPACFRPENFS